MDFPTFLSYLSGLYFIRPDLDPTTLLRTAVLLHILDAALCWMIASQSGRNKENWTVAGLFLGIWALGTLFLLPNKRKSQMQSEDCK